MSGSKWLQATTILSLSKICQTYECIIAKHLELLQQQAALYTLINKTT